MKFKIIALIIVCAAVPLAATAQTNIERTEIIVNTDIDVIEEVTVEEETAAEGTLVAPAPTNTNQSSVIGILEEVELPEAGILPDAKLYTLKLWWEQVRMFFTFNKVNKAELEAELALKRLAETKQLVANGNIELAEQNLLRYRNRFAAALQKTEEAKNQGRDVNEIVERLEVNSLKHQEVLAEIYEKVPESAKDGVLNAMEKSAADLQNAIESVQQSGQAEQFRNKVQNRIENLGTEGALEIKEHLQLKGVIDDDEGDDGDEEESAEAEGSDEEGNEEDDDATNVNSNTNSGQQVQTETQTQIQGQE